MNFIKKTGMIPILFFWISSCASIAGKEKSDSPETTQDRTALLILDVQNDFFPGGKFELSGAKTAALQGKIVLEFFRKKNWPVFHVQHVSTRKGATFFFPGTEGVNFEESNAPVDEEVTIVKHTVNPFLNTNLEKELKSRKIERLVIYGMMTHMVVDSTVRASFDLGFKKIVVIGDACATRDLSFDKRKISAADVHASFLSALGYIFAKVKTASEWVQEENAENKN
ncbi:cysteine hydrolase family protein [Leptospira yasudae]|uniref:cysteine hydrolase family protein n=1 Tax=Leptospira yasudae TaxID=2202201 RepID=UPI001C4F35F8|nr:cysteine hydrolase family protein [Leptospira yasudae]